MKTDSLAHLENRLREKVPTASPRPGFETRIQAMAREPYVPEKKSLARRIALPALAILAIGIVISPKNKPTESPTVTQPVPVEAPAKETTMARIEEPVQKEIEGLKKDAKWTMSLFKKALPSISLKKLEKDKNDPDQSPDR